VRKGSKNTFGFSIQSLPNRFLTRANGQGEIITAANHWAIVTQSILSEKLPDMRPILRVAAISIAAFALANCSEDRLSRFVVAPGKYTFYTCDEIATAIKNYTARKEELRQLMARASTDPAGRLIGTMTYESDYLSAVGELRDLRATAADKNCSAISPATPPAAPGPK